MPTTYSQPYNVLNVNCPSRRVLNLLADKWTMLVIIALDRGTRRHSQLMREIGGISQKMLTQTLRSLEQDGLVQRTVYPVVPPMVEYSLTPLGKTLTEPIQAIRTWAEQYLPEVEKARAGYVHAMTDEQLQKRFG
ncbi:MAG TPA: helix-turn-helix domain-containing protein [Ktedonobacteraceae bacterium]|jgi:DNA-binding HxlR family transcriptional regulator|nr:helix-turn-helix domain-containing protein [Ktedonobacteraceae bacterium]